MLPEWQQNIFFKSFQNFQALAKMLPKWQQNIFFKFFQNFQALARILPEWQHFYFIKFFKIFSACQNVARMAHLIKRSKILEIFEKKTFDAILSTFLQALENSEKI